MELIKSKCCNKSAKTFIEKRYYCSKCNKECNVYKDSSIISFIIFFIIIIPTITILIPLSLNKNEIVKNEIVQQQDVELTDSILTSKLIELGCILPNVALAQIKLESGHYTSNLTKTNKNLLGIKQGNKYKVYNTYTECLEDYIKIQNRYLQAIDGKYAEDTSYIYKLRNIK
jgi:hypothetical protein